MTDPLPFAVVTGASRGIGRSVALCFARHGYQVWALARSSKDLESLRAEAPERVRPLVVDLSDEAALLAACGQISAEGAPSVLVNNAGIVVSAPVHKTGLPDYDRMMAVNVRAPFILCQQLVPGMAARGKGRVINIASTAGLKGFKYTSVYCATKHALVGLTRSMSVELAAKGVTVNAVCPGWTDTEMVVRAVEEISRTTRRTEDEARRTLAQMNPMERFVRPEEVAELCLFLASEGAAAITGAAYVVDGGQLA